MAENARPPVAVRIVRPFETEDELLENELETIGKTSVVLIGAHSRPTGVILRFEVTLASGATVLRGEGRVLAHKENAFRGQPGLTLRFTRLDPKSKAVVDRATAMREARAPQAAASPIAQALTEETPRPLPTTSPKPPAIDQEAAVQQALVAAREKANAQARENARRTSRPAPPLPSGAPRDKQSLTPPPVPVIEQPEPEPARLPPPSAPESAPIVIDVPESEPMILAADAVTAIPGEVSVLPRRPVTPATTPSPPSSRSPLAPPAGRADLLGRLRDRASKLPADRVEQILAQRRPR